MQSRLAVIDCGSNSFRLVVFTYTDTWWKRTDEIHEPIRDAGNQAEFLRLARERSGLDVEVLPGPAEARYGYLAAVNSTTLRDGVVLDLGGGSMQLTRVRKRLARDARSWPLGAVRMTERFAPGRKK